MSSIVKKIPHYTYDDYCQWEGHWELIEGYPYAMSPAPTPRHQQIASHLNALFFLGLRNYKECYAYQPIDWKISDDTVVQPDLSIVCGKIDGQYLSYAPVLTAEILSPSTALKDRNEKFLLYQSQKVKYYLIIDTDFRKIEVYQLINDQYQPAAINPGTFNFQFSATCEVEINFTGIWD